MRFLADENIPLTSIRELRQAGYDVAAVIEDSPGASDQQVLARARHESRIVLTFDRDYGELIYRKQMPAPLGVLYFRFAPSSPDEPAKYLLNLLAAGTISLARKFTVARRDRIRQRPLPPTN
jgi:predicted nuclease of predicted toxin-antitoxin system